MTSVVPPPPTALQSTGMPQAPLVSQAPVRRADAPSRGRGLRAAALAALCLAGRRPLAALLTGGLGIAAIIGSVGASMFPFILPSSSMPAASLTVWDSSSSHLTLFIMLISAAIFMPIILTYTSWVFTVLRGKVDADDIRKGKGHAY